MPDADETWTDEEDARFAQRVAELYLEGKPEFTVEQQAAGEVNADRGDDTDGAGPTDDAGRSDDND